MAMQLTSKSSQQPTEESFDATSQTIVNLKTN